MGSQWKTLPHNMFHAVARGQRTGRWSVRRPCGRANRAGTLIRCRRSVAPRATPVAFPASVPAARSRLWVIAVSTVQVLSAGNNPQGMWAKVPSSRSAKSDSMIACRRWVISASATGSVPSVKKGWYRQTGNSSSGCVEVPHLLHDQPGGDLLGVPLKAVYSTRRPRRRRSIPRCPVFPRTRVVHWHPVIGRIGPIARFTEGCLVSVSENVTLGQCRLDHRAAAVGGVPADQDALAPAAFAVLIASVTMLAAPWPEPPGRRGAGSRPPPAQPSR